MKYLVVLSCLLVVAYGLSKEAIDGFKAKVTKMCSECRAELGATEDDVAPLLKNEPPTTEKGKCVLACVHKKMGFQDAAGKISKEGTEAALEKLKALDEELYGKMKTISETCMGKVTDEGGECETAVNMFVCVKNEKDAAGIPPIDWS